MWTFLGFLLLFIIIFWIASLISSFLSEAIGVILGNLIGFSALVLILLAYLIFYIIPPWITNSLVPWFFTNLPYIVLILAPIAILIIVLTINRAPNKKAS